MDTVGEVIIVRNESSGFWKPEDAWTLKEEFRIGSVDGQGNILLETHQANLSLGPQGHLFVVDYQAEDIKILGGNGVFLRRIAGPGPGPDGLRSPAGVGRDRYGRLWIANAFKRHYTVFDSTGELAKTMPRPVWGRARRWFPIWFDGSGGMIDEGQGDGKVVKLIRVDTAGTSVDTLLDLRFPERPTEAFLPPGFDKSLRRYFPELRWVIAPDSTIWSTGGGELRLVQRTFQGDTLRIVETTHRPGVIDSETRRTVEREFATIGVDVSGYPLAEPLVRAIHVLEDGHLLVHIAEGVVEQEKGVLDVFDPEGRFLGTLELGFRSSDLGAPALSGDTLVVVGVGDLDVPFLVRFTIKR